MAKKLVRRNGKLQKWDEETELQPPLLYHPTRSSAPPHLDMIRFLDIVHKADRGGTMMIAGSNPKHATSPETAIAAARSCAACSRTFQSACRIAAANTSARAMGEIASMAMFLILSNVSFGYGENHTRRYDGGGNKSQSANERVSHGQYTHTLWCGG